MRRRLRAVWSLAVQLWCVAAAAYVDGDAGSECQDGGGGALSATAATLVLAGHAYTQVEHPVSHTHGADVVYTVVFPEDASPPVLVLRAGGNATAQRPFEGQLVRWCVRREGTAASLATTRGALRSAPLIPSSFRYVARVAAPRVVPADDVPCRCTGRLAFPVLQRRRDVVPARAATASRAITPPGGAEPRRLE